MEDPLDKLVRYWRSQELKISAGNSEGRIREFESRHAVVLPSDFREYFLRVDGMTQIGGHDCDKNGFAFWPLSRVKSATEEFGAHSSKLPDLPEPGSYFVFADYMQWSWAYAIRLGVRAGSEHNPIVHVGTSNHKTVANSFTDFMELYLRDGKELYVEAAITRETP